MQSSFSPLKVACRRYSQRRRSRHKPRKTQQNWRAALSGISPKSLLCSLSCSKPQTFKRKMVITNLHPYPLTAFMVQTDPTAPNNIRNRPARMVDSVARSLLTHFTQERDAVRQFLAESTPAPDQPKNR
jgi:hypothetical protein